MAREPGKPGFRQIPDDIIRNYSELVVLDAQAIEQGPICRIKLPFRLRQGLHGNWADERALTPV